MEVEMSQVLQSDSQVLVCSTTSLLLRCEVQMSKVFILSSPPYTLGFLAYSMCVFVCYTCYHRCVCVHVCGNQKQT